MEKKDKDIWFPAKKYGWGWGIPLTWQGWAVLFAYSLLLTLASFWVVFYMDRIVEFFIFVFALTGVLIWICVKKGEKPKWRWGNKKE